MNYNYHYSAVNRAVASNKVRRPIHLSFHDFGLLQARTAQASPSGITVMRESLTENENYRKIELDSQLSGEMQKIKADSKTGNFVCAWTEGFAPA